MEKSNPPVDWGARALDAMEQQKNAEENAAFCPETETSDSISSGRLFGGIAQLIFLACLGYFLVQQFGIFHLVWIGLVIWFKVIPSMTFRPKTAYR